MEETQIETMTTSNELAFFPPHRRRHLKSETFRTLVRILSQCYDKSPSSLAAQNVDHELNTENGGNELGQRTKKLASQHVELAGNDSIEAKSLVSEKKTEVNLSVEDIGSQDRRFGEQMTIHQIEQLMGFEENVDLSNQEDLIGFQNPRIGYEQMIMDELEHNMKGNKDNVNENNLKPPQNPLVEKQSEIDEVDILDKKEELVGFQQYGIRSSVSVGKMLSSLDDIGIGGSGSPRENDKDRRSLLNAEVMELNSVSVTDLNDSSVPFKESGEFDSAKFRPQKGSEHSNILLDKNTVADTLDLCNNNDDQGSLKADALTVDFEMPVKNKELEKAVCGGDMVGSADHRTEDADMEEGEIFGDYSIDDISMDTLLQDAEMLENKRVDAEPLNRCLQDKGKAFCVEPNERDSRSTSFAIDTVDNNNSGAVVLREIGFNKTVCATDIVVHDETLGAGKLDADDSMLSARKIEKKGIEGNNNIAPHEQIVEEDATRLCKISTEKEVFEVRLKRKRGPSTKEKKARKKAKDRKKRAEKNRQLGVKRLKLPLISKPKIVSYCRHYLNGRCQEGENCKFSHDTIPWTKSKPCSYFVRHQCMKGDDCPFDHELSKYPCSSFVSRGFCSKGDGCMFAHKIIPKDAAITASAAMETETKLSSLIGDSTSTKQPKNDGASLHTPRVLSYFKQIHSQKNPEKNAQETVSKQSNVVTKGTASFISTVANSPFIDSSKLKQQKLSPNNENHSEQCGSGVVWNSDEILKGTPPAVAPKGINFLAFGVQQDDLSSRKLASTLSSGDNGVKLSPSDNSNTHNQTSLAPCSNPVPRGIQPAVVPKGISFLSFGKVSANDSCSKGNAVLPSSSDNGPNSCVKGKQNAFEEPQCSCTTLSTMPSSPISLVQSSNGLASRIYKDTPQSAQKALLSTLAFAAKCESRIKLNQSNHDPVVATETDKNARNKGVVGGSQDGLVKASKILEFFSSIGSKSEQ